VLPTQNVRTSRNVHTYTNVHIYTNVHTYANVHIYTNVHTYANVHIYSNVRARTERLYHIALKSERMRYFEEQYCVLAFVRMYTVYMCMVCMS
jgi:hypothetical protein